MPLQHTRPRAPDTAPLAQRYGSVRALTVALCAPLDAEDMVLQSMPDASPPKWHLAHTTWFFETFVLAAHVPDYRVCDPAYDYLFNSYYESVGRFHPRARRGLLSRPTTAQVLAYRAHVDAAMVALLADRGQAAAVAKLVELGLHHEQQHQELLLMDVKHHLGTQPLRPAYRADLPPPPAGAAPPLHYIERPAGLAAIGHAGPAFAFDNESPRHRVYVPAHRLACRPVTNAEWLAFMADGGYRTATLWLSDGWAAVQARAWEAPLYWERQDGAWWRYTLGGMRALDPAAPVTHVSYYEADAYARWTGARLPTEAEWELAAAGVEPAGNLLDAGYLEPASVPAIQGIGQLYGDVWEWTASPYLPYPGFRPPAGALGEYNGKFMSGQMVLRGGCCVTPPGHLRPTYRNFYPPDARWPFTGVRLAMDA
jgi:ergothioneine biosynthesis protein EgtB